MYYPFESIGVFHYQFKGGIVGNGIKSGDDGVSVVFAAISG
jgi:hypothetical protein